MKLAIDIEADTVWFFSLQSICRMSRELISNPIPHLPVLRQS